MRASELKDLSLEDLNDRLEELIAAYRKIQLAHVVSTVENPLQIRGNRRDIARVKTEIRNRELAA